jgi:hypothetical protein
MGVGAVDGEVDRARHPDVAEGATLRVEGIQSVAAAGSLCSRPRLWATSARGRSRVTVLTDGFAMTARSAVPRWDFAGRPSGLSSGSRPRGGRGGGLHRRRRST